MTTTRFQTVSQEYEALNHAEVTTARAELRPGHVITREHAWMDHFGPVPGTHHTSYTCTCGGTFGTPDRPHSRHLENLPHFDSEADRAAYEADRAAKLERIKRSLGMDR